MKLKFVLSQRVREDCLHVAVVLSWFEEHLDCLYRGETRYDDGDECERVWKQREAQASRTKRSNPPRSTSAQVNFDDDSPRAVRMRSRI
jgi:hypothetical protein